MYLTIVLLYSILLLLLCCVRYIYFHWAVHPSSMVNAAPLTCLAFSLTKKHANSPISSGLLNFPDGCFSSTSFFEACSIVILSLLEMISICFSISGVNTHPGHMAFDVIPCLAYYRAVAFVNPIIPCFADTYADLFIDATNPWTDETLMILPHELFNICGIHSLAK